MTHRDNSYARRRHQRGYALLFVFALAAGVACLLYLEMPRIGFEHQRSKELLLQDRGEQYIRAIYLFQKKVGKLPQTIEELEQTNNQRFLRRRYRDPMTGEEEWRIIHVDAAGQYTDSLNHKKGEDKKNTPSVLSSNIVGIGDSAQFVQGQGDKTNAATQKRASDRIIPGTPGAAGNAAPSDDPNADASRSGQTPQPGQGLNPLSPEQPNGVPNPFQRPPTAIPGQAGTTATGTNQSNSTQSQFGFGGGFGNTPSQGSNTSQTGTLGSPSLGGANASAAGMSGGMGGFNNSSMGGFGQTGSRPQGSVTPNSAVQAIMGSLTNQRQTGTVQGVSGAPGQAGVQGMQGQQGTGVMGPGMVGVASKKEGDAILVYNEKSTYPEWEFVFDAKKAAEMAGKTGQTGTQQNPNQQGTGQNSSGFGGFGSSGNRGSGSGSSMGGSSFGSGFGSGSGSSGNSSSNGLGGFTGGQSPAPGGFRRQ